MENQKLMNNVEKWQKLDECGGLRVKRITPVGKKKVYDITVADCAHYILENGVVTHNTGIYYSADIIFIVGRQQEKDGTEVSGFNFIINVEKSRFVREKSKIPVQVLHESGISKWSGMLDIGVESGFVVKPKVGWYSRVNDDGEVEEKLWRAAQTECMEFWKPILASQKFTDKISSMYKVGNSEILTDDQIDAEMEKVEDGEEETI